LFWRMQDGLSDFFISAKGFGFHRGKCHNHTHIRLF
jgi:hypothetical protein